MNLFQNYRAKIRPHKLVSFGWLILAAWACLANVSLAQTPQAVVSHEFIYENAPFPECHAATIVETKAGTLVTSWFGGTAEKNPDVGIWVSRRTDGKWSAPLEVANGVQPSGPRLPTWNPVLFQPMSGPLSLYFKVGPAPNNWWGERLASSDDGKSWSGREKLPNGGIGPVKNKAIQLSDGTIICPSSDEADGWTVHLEITRDNGKSWTKVGPLNDGKKVRAIQPTMLQLGGPKLCMLCRDGRGDGVIWQTFSNDNGLTWTPFESSQLPNPNSGIDAITLRDGRHLLVYNHTIRSGSSPRGRERLGVAISKDAKTWQPALTLEEQRGEYSYPAVIQTNDGLVHIVYTWNRKRVRHVVVDTNKLNASEFADGKWPSDKIEKLEPASAPKG